jgi:chromosomal replication initiation ATPase DnaA
MGAVSTYLATTRPGQTARHTRRLLAETPADTPMLFAILRKQPGAQMVPATVLDYLIGRNSVNIQSLLDDYALACIYAATVGEAVDIELVRQAFGDE